MRGSFPAMSTLAEQLDARLQQLDPRTAAHVEQVVREILALTEPATQDVSPLRSPQGTGLAELATFAEPMGTLTNAEIDRAVYGG